MSEASRGHDTELLIGRVLTIGTRVSSVLLVVGLVMALAGGSRLTHAVLSAGLLVLMATPIARVATSVVEFALRREWWFVLCTAFVLALLIGSLAVALRG